MTWPHWQPYIPLSFLISAYHNICLLLFFIALSKIYWIYFLYSSGTISTSQIFEVIKLTSKSTIDALTVITPIKKNEKLCNFSSLVCHNAMHSCFETLHAGKWSFHHFEYISVLTIPSYVLQHQDHPTHWGGV